MTVVACQMKRFIKYIYILFVICTVSRESDRLQDIFRTIWNYSEVMYFALLGLL